MQGSDLREEFETDVTACSESSLVSNEVSGKLMNDYKGSPADIKVSEQSVLRNQN